MREFFIGLSIVLILMATFLSLFIAQSQTGVATWLTFVSASIGTGMGAYLAYWLQTRKEVRQDRTTDISEIKKMVLSIWYSFQLLTEYRNQVIVNNHKLLPIYYILGPKSISNNLESKITADIPTCVYRKNYELAFDIATYLKLLQLSITSIQDYSHHHGSFFQQVMKQIDRNQQADLETIMMVDNILRESPDDYFNLTGSAKNTVYSVDKACVMGFDVIKRLVELAQKHYPESNLVINEVDPKLMASFKERLDMTDEEYQEFIKER